MASGSPRGSGWRNPTTGKFIKAPSVEGGSTGSQGVGTDVKCPRAGVSGFAEAFLEASAGAFYGGRVSVTFPVYPHLEEPHFQVTEVWGIYGAEASLGVAGGIQIVEPLGTTYGLTA